MAATPGAAAYSVETTGRRFSHLPLISERRTLRTARSDAAKVHSPSTPAPSAEALADTGAPHIENPTEKKTPVTPATVLSPAAVPSRSSSKPQPPAQAEPPSTHESTALPPTPRPLKPHEPRSNLARPQPSSIPQAPIPVVLATRPGTVRSSPSAAASTALPIPELPAAASCKSPTPFVLPRFTLCASEDDNQLGHEVPPIPADSAPTSNYDLPLRSNLLRLRPAPQGCSRSDSQSVRRLRRSSQRACYWGGRAMRRRQRVRLLPHALCLPRLHRCPRYLHQRQRHRALTRRRPHPVHLRQ